ncbi:hypothetical protein O3790_02040 [Micrococcus luteus]|uniref:hypothetical protein n=1 Tax=Micrococcus luteus TaxID=1270 RepID=UPI00352D981A
MSVAPRAAVPPAPTETGTTAVLAGLRVALHVTFAALLTVGLARALADRSPDASGPFPATTLVLLTAALAGVYLAGTVLERRRWARGDDVGRGPAVAWLALVLLLWGLLVGHHGDFAWVAFPSSSSSCTWSTGWPGRRGCATWSGPRWWWRWPPSWWPGWRRAPAACGCRP